MVDAGLSSATFLYHCFKTQKSLIILCLLAQVDSEK